jgi:hypothetical protein
MKANIPKSYLHLPDREKKIISDLMAKQVNDTIDAEEDLIQKVWLQWACIVLHEAFGFGKHRCMMFLGSWKRMYRKNRTFKTDLEQQKFLEAKINKIFKNEYPSDFVNSL